MVSSNFREKAAVEAFDLAVVQNKAKGLANETRMPKEFDRQTSP